MNGDFQAGQKHMARLILEMLRNRPADEERGIAENKIQNMIDNFDALPDERPVVGFVRMHRGIPDFERQPCFGPSADSVLAGFTEGNKTPMGYEFVAEPLYR
jgi:hypothetical protein